MPFKWLRRFVRQNTKPIPMDVAHQWKRRLSLAYGFFAWNAFALVGYAMYTGRRDWAEYHGIPGDKMSPAQGFARMMDIPKATVIKISGFKVEEYEIDDTKLYEEFEDKRVK